MIRSLVGALSFVAGLFTVAWAPDAYAQQDSRREAFERDVRPVLIERCGSCHGPETQRASLRLDHISFIREGGLSGPALVPGDVDASRMIHGIRYTDIDFQMPPRARLADSTIATLERWVADGAYWPDEPVPVASTPADAFDLQRRKAEHWSWQPIQRPDVPDDAAFASNHPIDRFIGAQLTAASMTPAKKASRATLLRRVSFDLTGLPPTPDAVREFIQDPEPDAYEKVVDRLLASPQYGERQARHWMDLFRYAETYGHEFDYPIEGAWRYRDYLIRAFNTDVPLDQRIREHIAGDLLDPPRRNPEDGTNESVQATTHFLLYQATHSPVDPRQDLADRIDNQIDVLTKSFLGLTVACARCHDHKFDAISTADYYAFAGFLKSSRRQEAFLDPHGEIARATAAAEKIHQRANQALRDALGGPQAERPATLAAYLLAATSEVPAPTAATEYAVEDLAVLEKSSGDYRRQDLQSFSRSEQWRGRDHMWWTGAAPGDRLVLGVPVPADGRYQITIRFTQARDYGRVQVAVDGAPLGAPVDLFDPEVGAKTVTFENVAMKAGQSALSFQIVGANAAAVKAYMIGLDQISIDDPSAHARRESSIADTAKQRGLDPARLLAWTDLVLRLKNGEGADGEHPLRPVVLDLIRPKEAGAKHSSTSDLVATVNSATPTTHRLFEDFESGYDRWFRSGEAFRARPTRAGEWIAGTRRHDDRDDGSEEASEEGSEDVLGRITEGGVAHSGVLSGRHQGALRSQTFIIEEPVIHYRLAGSGHGAQIRLIVDGYFMDVHNALLFGGYTFGVDTGGRFQWHPQNVAKYLGHRAHIEILDHGDGFVAVDEIWFGGSERPRREAVARSSVPAEITPLPGTPGAVAADFADEVFAIQRAIARGARVDDGDIAIVDALLADGLLFRPTADPRATDPSASKAERYDALAILQSLERRITAQADAVPRPIRALAIADGTGEDERVYIRGRHSNLGDIAPRRFLTAIAGDAQPTISAGSGRRELAERMLAPENPFPARVAVNRTWHHLFGRGIVPSVDNFGVLGQSPSHPELLDWLADWFRTDAKWSEKALVRLIVTSEAYQQASTSADPEADRVDPENVLLHRMNVRRLEGEAIRDAILAVSGQLDPTVFGPPVPIHLTEFMDGRGRPGRSGPLDGAGRRSVYVEVRRNFLSPMMLAFDTPTPFSTVGRRSISNVPAQGLILMNDPFVVQEAKETAASLIAAADDDSERLDLLFLRALAREPDPVERAALLTYVHARAEEGEPSGLDAAWSDACHAVLNLKEFTFLR